MADSKVRNSIEQEKEIWKPIEGYEGFYEISNKGRVKSYHNGGRILKLERQGSGHLRIQLCKNGDCEKLQVHRLVGKAFIPNPENKPHINHIDNDPANNYPYNLEWVTPSENSLHAFRTGRKSMAGENHSQNKLTRKEVLKIRERYSDGDKLTDLGREFGVSHQAIYKIVNREKWVHI